MGKTNAYKVNKVYKVLKYFLVGVIIIVSLPIILYIALLLYIELSEQTISQITLPEEIIKVTKKINGGFGPSHYYRVFGKFKDADNFKYITGWERPSGQENIETYQYLDLMVLLTPNRNVLSVRGKEGKWKVFNLEQMFNNKNLSHPKITLEKNHYPRAWIKEFDNKSGHVKVELISVVPRKYIVVLNLMENGKNLNIVDVK